jgi:hypothetical protein
MRHLFGRISDEGLTVAIATETSPQSGVAPSTPIARQQSAWHHSAFFFAMILACPVGAAEWKEYQFPDHSFTVYFPTDPKIEMTAYQTPDGRSFDAHVCSATQETGAFTLTVAQIPETGNQVQEHALMNDAVKKMSEGGLIKFDIQHRIRWIYGRQLGIAGVNGGYSYVAVFHHNNLLYQIQGRVFVAGGQAEVDAMRFQQSLDFP